MREMFLRAFFRAGPFVQSPPQAPFFVHTSKTMRILLVEDDPMIGEGVVDGLSAEGYAVDWVQDGNSALIALRTTPFSLVILDLGLPGKDGISVLHEVRSQKIHTPVLVTTARDTVADRVAGLDLSLIHI